MMQYLPTHGYELSNCSSIIRNLVYDHGGGELSAVTEAQSAEEKATAACNRHSEAERRRRKRINGHLATLRSLLPSNVKTDKASLLAEVVRRVKELKKMAAELEPKGTDQSDDTTRNMIPSENDELQLTYIGEDSSTRKMMIKVLMCCEDRGELIVELKRALGLVRGKVMRMEIATLGGRIKCVLWVQVFGATREQGLHELRRALKVVMDRGAFLDMPRNKRPRISGCI
ncbi:unnamed protein product [Lactuca saligna]|uniref:BHLH domain-containing protein n=1 Tax=Lactuca saligna TaxID=75948 RepID=A0AA35YEM4_LACSI|nr:unnamed protein product [Lactuca saligna]